MQESAPLSSAEKKELRGMAQRLKAHVHVGKNGLTENVLAEIGTALLKNGLIKVKFESDRSQHKEWSATLRTSSTVNVWARWAKALYSSKKCRLQRLRTKP